MRNALCVGAALVIGLGLVASVEGGREALQDRDAEELKRPAPDAYRVKFETTEGTFVVSVTRAWAPVGADRFYHLARNGFYDDQRFFRVVPDFVVQFGMSGDPQLQSIWQLALLKDDPVKQSNTRGTLTFAKTAQPHSRTTQVFINLQDNTKLDGMGFAPFATITEGMEVVDALYSGYGDAPPAAHGPVQQQIAKLGNTYLDAHFPQLDRILKVTVLDAAPAK